MNISLAEVYINEKLDVNLPEFIRDKAEIEGLYIIESPHSSLADVARHFGFSREYARQVYKNIYGHPYTKVYREKLEIRKTERMKSGRGTNE